VIFRSGYAPGALGPEYSGIAIKAACLSGTALTIGWHNFGPMRDVAIKIVTRHPTSSKSLNMEK
jgi:hypothetical protein